MSLFRFYASKVFLKKNVWNLTILTIRINNTKTISFKFDLRSEKCSPATVRHYLYARCDSYFECDSFYRGARTNVGHENMSIVISNNSNRRENRAKMHTNKT